MNEMMLPQGVFTRNDLLTAAQTMGDFRETQLRNLIATLMDEGRIVRVGRGRYVVATTASTKPAWMPQLSDTARRVAETLAKELPRMEVRVWELSWLNEFLNHLVARNTIFACVEVDGCEYAFDVLVDSMPGRVLYRPNIEDYVRYGSQDTVVVTRLVSEAPRYDKDRRHVALEQLVVDLFADRLVRKMLPRDDYPDAVHEMFYRYTIDQPSLFRYARRRNRESELRSFLVEEAEVELYV